ncbi:MAG: VWA domain-containing protein [Ignavibacteria bacterium]|nr:VWA domain-containing protein [Ignavibacteria bacterium]
MEHISLYLSIATWWWFALAVAVLGAITTISYGRTTPVISSASKLVLILLRTTGMALLLLALFGPLLHTILSTTKQPAVVIAIDASTSMTLIDGAGDRQATVRSVLAEVRSLLTENGIYYSFGDGARRVEDFANDSLQFTDYRTNISDALQTISNQAEQTSAKTVLLISDGNHNTGESPIYFAEKGGMPVYTIGIGDTVQPSDVSADVIVAPNIGYVGQPLSITVDASWQSIPETETDVILTDNGLEVAREKLYIRNNRSSQTVQFNVKPQQAGTRKFSVMVKPVNGEFTTKNNRVEQFIDIRTDKRTVIVYAGAPSSDVSFITGILAANPALQVKTFIQKQGAEFYPPAPDAATLQKAELCVLIGFPISSTPQSLIEQIGRECGKGLPLLFIAGINTDYTRLKPLNSVLPFMVAASRPNEFQITADVPAASTTNPILRLLGSDTDAETWNNLPPVFRTETFVTRANGGRTLATIRVNNSPLDEPLFMYTESGSVKCFAILAHGIYRWKLLEDAPKQVRGQEKSNVLDRLVLNSVQWLGVKNSDKRVVIKPSHKFYAATEPVRFTANVADAALRPSNNAEVNVIIQGGGKEFTFILSPQDNGRYYANIGNLPPADYTYKGTAVENGTELGTDAGRFSVTDVSVEDAATWCNTRLLSEIAIHSGGEFGHSTKAKAIVEALLQNPAMREIVETRERERLLWHLPWMLVAAITCFGAEWFLRKRRGLL